MPIPDEDALVNGLRDFIALEKELEASKITLTQRPDFNLHDAFKIFDRSHHGSVNVAEIRDGLAAIGVYPTCEELDLFFKKYDTDLNQMLNFHEFSMAFIASDLYNSEVLNSRPANHRN